MKKLYIFLASCLLLSTTINANNTQNQNRINSQEPLVFVENGVEYAVFSNGDFDFNVIQHKSANININTRNLNVSFNTGRNYQPYIQHDNYGFITQINSTPIFYNHNGKVNRIGNININYNYRGLVSSIGQLNIYYNNYGVAYNRRGYINRSNINYRPIYKLYKRPVQKRVVTYNKVYKPTKYVNKYSNYKKYTSTKNRNYKTHSSNKNNQKSYKKQESNKNESYRTNSNSYRRNTTSSSSKYASTNIDTSKKYKKR